MNVTPHSVPESRDPHADLVVGVDGSPSARSALRWAAAQAKATGGRIHAIMAWEYPALYGWEPTHPHQDFAATAGRVLSQSVHDALGSDLEVPVEESVIPGHPAQVLIDASQHAALLVVGSRGHGTFAGTLLGSVSQHCVQHAACPVVVIRGKL
jgi:nucleotide-binding universal stress UspA family protein